MSESIVQMSPYSQGDGENPPQEQENNPEVPEVPVETIEFSSLSKADKLRYFNFFLANGTEFRREKDGFYVAEIDVLGEEEIKPVDLEESVQGKSAKKKEGKRREYDEIYPKLLNTLGISPQLKGSKMKLFTLRALIQEIYALKFNRDTQILLSGEDAEPEDFPIFVGNYLIEKYGKKKTLEKSVGDLILSIDYFSLSFRDIKVFQLFLSEEYDTDDLIFFLFLRSCVEKELQVSFLEKSREDARVFQGYTGFDFEADSEDTLVSPESLRRIATAVFGQEKRLLEKFVNRAEEIGREKNSKGVGANQILTIGVSDYHNSRANGQLEEDQKEQDIYEEKQEPMLVDKITKEENINNDFQDNVEEQQRKDFKYKSQPASNINKTTSKKKPNSNLKLATSLKPNTVKTSNKSNIKAKSPLKGKNQGLKSNLLKKSVSPKKKVITSKKK